jgi:hypothetical protein
MKTLIWLIPALPLLGFVLLVVGGRKLGEPGRVARHRHAWAVRSCVSVSRRLLSASLRRAPR